LVQAFGSHALTIDDEPCHRMSSCGLLIADQELEDAFGQVQVAPGGGSQVGMPLRVVQKQERASAQHFARAPNEAPWKQVIAVHRLAVPIHIEGWRRAVWF
jgi:hypothetical protein